MFCQACGWNREYVKNLSFCPDCGLSEHLDSYASHVDGDFIHCYACNTVMLFRELKLHTCG
jgi:hypothetical protein